ncbi:hypothetical protein F53441_13722 [Fusarium austroafricanum]|uniref:Uncharacterized protein n=1 Tax=Fusarium austroafricanum TaxID=2364996 RepID=A0A8H4NIL4_9HYPO|nr:hypothetical protein F53441_13722 [Fusarium austroafricanum]
MAAPRYTRPVRNPEASQSLVFIVGTNPGSLKANASVRSHVSKQGWKPYTGSYPKRGRRGKPKIQATVYEYTDQDDSQVQVPLPPLERQLGGGRVDPFRAYPGPWNPEIPSLVDHYLVHMAVEIPELDQPGNRGLLRTSWFPLVISHEAPFQTILLLSASNLSSVSGTTHPTGFYYELRHNAISAINQALLDSDDCVSDGIIGAVAKMASFEAMHGNKDSYRIHMKGLHDMICRRQGLNALGLDGLLRRIVIWIDLNSSFLLQIPRMFPDEYFADGASLTEPNPERFIAP